MDYIDLDGKIIREDSSQDRLLNFFYTTVPGRLLLKPLVHPLVSSFLGKLLSLSFSTAFIPFFLKKGNIDLSEYQPAKYGSFNDCFARKIRPEARPICSGQNILISPCDCRATVFPITDSSIFTVKNTSYSLTSLLHSHYLSEKFRGGYAYILRLTVSDYHRYVYAVSGRKSKNYHIKGIFHTVNPIANDYRPIYIENSREYTVIHSEKFGDVLQMEVGALLVGKISNHHENTKVLRGEEKGYFEYGGSTIIILTEKNKVQPRIDLLENTNSGFETRILQGHNLGTAKF